MWWAWQQSEVKDWHCPVDRLQVQAGGLPSGAQTLCMLCTEYKLLRCGQRHVEAFEDFFHAAQFSLFIGEEALQELDIQKPAFRQTGRNASSVYMTACLVNLSLVTNDLKDPL